MRAVALVAACLAPLALCASDKSGSAANPIAKDLAALERDLRGLDDSRHQRTSDDPAFLAAGRGSWHAPTAKTPGGGAVPTLPEGRTSGAWRTNQFMGGQFNPELYNYQWHKRLVQVQPPNCCCRGCGATAAATNPDEGEKHRFRQPFKVSCTDICESGKFKDAKGQPLRCAEAEVNGCSRLVEEERLAFPAEAELEPLTQLAHLKAARPCGASKRCLFVRVHNRFQGDYVKITVQRNIASEKIRGLEHTFGDLGRIGKHWGDSQHLYAQDTAVYALEDNEDRVTLAISVYNAGNAMSSRVGEAYCIIYVSEGRHDGCKASLNFNEGWRGVLNSVENVLRGNIQIQTFAT